MGGRGAVGGLQNFSPARVGVARDARPSTLGTPAHVRGPARYAIHDALRRATGAENRPVPVIVAPKCRKLCETDGPEWMN